MQGVSCCVPRHAAEEYGRTNMGVGVLSERAARGDGGILAPSRVIVGHGED